MNKYLVKIAAEYRHGKDTPDLAYTAHAAGGAGTGYILGGVGGYLGSYGVNTLRNNHRIAANAKKLLAYQAEGVTHANPNQFLTHNSIDRISAAKKFGGTTAVIGAGLGLHYALKQNKEHLLGKTEKKAALDSLIEAGFDFDAALEAVKSVKD